MELRIQVPATPDVSLAALMPHAVVAADRECSLAGRRRLGELKHHATRLIDGIAYHEFVTHAEVSPD